MFVRCENISIVSGVLRGPLTARTLIQSAVGCVVLNWVDYAMNFVSNYYL